MEVNIVGQHDQIIYQQNIKKYTGSIEDVQSSNHHNRIILFCARIRLPKFKFNKNYSSRVDAGAELIRQNIKNNLEIKNTMLDCGDHYLVKLSGGKNFLANKVDLHFIEGHIWCSINDYVCSTQNKRQIRFHNLILGHVPTFNATVDHINHCRFDNRRINLRIATQQVQSINQTPQNGTIQSGVCFNKKNWVANWIDEQGIQKCVWFSINKYSYEAAKQLAINKRSEIELTLNHYCLALHNLPPLEPQVPEADYEFIEEAEDTD